MSFCDNFRSRLVEEKKNNTQEGLYDLIQRDFAYHSNKIEGSKLTKEQVYDLLNGKSIIPDDYIRAKDIEETLGHFDMFNLMLDTLDEPLSEQLIKSYHKELKKRVFEDIANGYIVGSYKDCKNSVGSITTALPSEVSSLMSGLLIWYNTIRDKNLETLVEFHKRYERIHPFQDGNGRTGRLIIFKECLRLGVNPFIICADNKSKYFEALLGVGNELFDYFIDEQDYFESMFEDSKL